MRLLLIGLVGSSAANGLLPVTQSFAVLRVTGSTGKLGVVLAAQAAAALLLSLGGGVAGDRWPRGRILVLSTGARMTTAAIISALLVANAASFAALLLISVGYGCANGFFGPAAGAVLPDVVAPERLAPANALVGGLSSAANVVAPGVAGIIVATVGPAAGFAAGAAMLALAAACFAAARIPAIKHDRGRAGPGMLGQLRAGWRVYAAVRWLWLLTAQWTVFSLLVVAPLAVVGPAIALRFLGGAAAWGVISSCLTLGVVTGQLVTGRLRMRRPLLVCAWLCPVGGTEALALGLGAPVQAVGIAAVVSGVAMGINFVIFQATLQRTVPAPVLARVAAFDLVGSEVGQPAGYALAGPVSAALGSRAFIAVAAAVAIAVSIPFTRARSLRDPIDALAQQAAVSAAQANAQEASLRRWP